MTRNLKQAKLLAGALALVVGLTLVAPPAFAAGPAPDPRPITAAAAAMVDALPAERCPGPGHPGPRRPTATAGRDRNKPFFKTTKGVVALALLAGSLGYMAYSFSNDRVKSPAR